MSNLLDRTGEKFTTNEGYEIEIIEYFNTRNSTVKIGDVILFKKDYQWIRKGKVKNPYHISVHGVGYIGVGRHKCSIGRKKTKAYDTWANMLERCYNKASLIKRPTYIGCSVVEEWHNFQNYAEWFEVNYRDGFYLDKDILKKGNKIYGPYACVFVPNEINVLFVKRDSLRGKYPLGVCEFKGKFIAQIGTNGKRGIILGSYDTAEESFTAYKYAKEKYIKEVANKWRGKISERTYQAMMNYKVEITD